jgi:FixJ family two-component response regulator
MQRGAADFLEKPYTDDALIDRLDRAFKLQKSLHAEARRHDFLVSLWAGLTPQQRRVALLVAAGNLNKVIAGSWTFPSAWSKCTERACSRSWEWTQRLDWQPHWQTCGRCA